ncbi:MAG: rRNA maturation RNase YbeY [Candidatus Brocadiaceae bacterium]|jgi:probable rRNA maturation factor
MRVEICSRQKAIDCEPAEIRRVVRTALRQEGRDAELSVALVGDELMTRLNRRFLGRDAVTDVLAFPYGSRDDCIEGEIIVNAELALRQSADRPHEAKDELMLYLVHGLLHLLGYDDHDPEQIRRMRDREQQVLSAAGCPAEF